MMTRASWPPGLNQDPLENFFGVMRQKAGSNRNPTTSQFRGSFGSAACFTFFKYSEITNCEYDEDELLTASDIPPMPIVEDIQQVNDRESGEDGNIEPASLYFLDEDLEEEFEAELISREEEFPKPTTLEDCANAYVAGYLAKKSLQDNPCDICKRNWVDSQLLDDPTNHLILQKTFGHVGPQGGLNTPTPALSSLVYNSFVAYSEKLEQVPSYRGVKADLMNDFIPKRMKTHTTLLVLNWT